MFEVSSTNGDTHWAATTTRGTEQVVAEVFRPRKGSTSQGPMALQRSGSLREGQDRLSSVQETTINLPFIIADQSGPALCRPSPA